MVSITNEAAVMGNSNQGDRERSGGRQGERQYQSQSQQGQQGQQGQRGAGQRQQGDTSGTQSPSGAGQLEQTNDVAPGEMRGSVWYEPTTGVSGATRAPDRDGSAACGPDDDSDLRK
jgi:hypothetical protein